MSGDVVASDIKIVRRAPGAAPWHVNADICVVGAGIAGTSVAIEAARLGRRVVLIDGLPVLGGQAVNSIIGTFCGLYANGTHGHRFTHGIADDIIEALGKNKEQLYFRHGPTTTGIAGFMTGDAIGTAVDSLAGVDDGVDDGGDSVAIALAMTEATATDNNRPSIDLDWWAQARLTNLR